MIEFSNRLRALPGYPLAEIPAIKRRLLDAGVDVIDLGAGDNDTPPPEPVIDTMLTAVRTPALSKYGFQQGLLEYRQAASRWVARRFGIEFDPIAEVLPLLGSKEGLVHIVFAVVNPGDIAIVPEPGYQAYLGGAILSGATPHVVPLRQERGFLLELDQLPEEVLQRAKVVFVNYPNNPTAAVATPEYLARTVAVCRQYGILLCYDNAYCDLTFDGYRAPSIFETPGARDVAVEFFSLSKSFSMTGWRIGFAVGSKELIGAFTRVKSYVDTGPWLAVQKAGAAALDRAEELVVPVRTELERRRDAGVAALREAGFMVDSPKAAMYLWVSLPREVPSAVFARRALEEQGVVVLPGSAFGPAGEGFFRIALTVGPERLAEAAGRLGVMLARVRRGELATSA
jgi:LL-diaminopimelate aminotransferase